MREEAEQRHRPIAIIDPITDVRPESDKDRFHRYLGVKGGGY